MLTSLLRRTLATAAVVTLAGSTTAMAATVTVPVAGPPTTTLAPAGPSAQGIIMRDGGICDPIRHMGC